MSMFQPAISLSVGTRPSPNLPLSAWAATASAVASSGAANISSFDIGIAHLAGVGDPPGYDGVVVIDRVQAPDFLELRKRRLHIAALVGGAAHDDGRLSVPVPGKAEARQRAGKHRLLKLRRRPASSFVRGDIDTGDLAMTAPGDARDFVEPLFDLLRPGWARDDRLGLHVEGELPRLSVRHRVRIFRRLL